MIVGLTVAGHLQIAVAQEGGLRSGQPGMAGEWAEGADRPGQPETMDRIGPPPRMDRAAGFSSAYARARSPRVVVFWNRELTDDIETEREEVTEFSSRTTGSASADLDERSTRRGSHSRYDSTSESGTDGTIRTTSGRLDRGRRASPYSDADDFDLQRGFVQALSNAGVRLIDRTTIVRAAALGSDPANAQAVEMKALQGRADWTMEVTPLSRGSGDGAFKIVVRDVRSGEIVAMTVSDGQPEVGRMPYVAGPNGFVRATPAAVSPLASGRQIAVDAMAAIAGSRR